MDQEGNQDAIHTHRVQRLQRDLAQSKLVNSIDQGSGDQIVAVLQSD
jgi:hypothetical protein